MSSKYCTKCGNKINYKEEYCTKCGAKINSLSNHLNNNNKFNIKNKKNIMIVFLLISTLLFSILYITNISISKSVKIENINLKSENQKLLSEQSHLNDNIGFLSSDLADKERQIESKDKDIKDLIFQVVEKQEKIKELKDKLGITKQQLDETTELYKIAQPYQERVERGQNLKLYYYLLGDYQDYTKPIILNYLGFSQPLAPNNDEELWQRGKKVYQWLTDNYEYCGDKGLRVGTTFNQFQFFSPDELLVSDNHRCGDCDDFATLFSGLMYASGVPKEKVWVVCGMTESGGHCWNWLALTDNTYRIDGVCSQEKDLFSILGLGLGIQGAYYTNIPQNIDCFSKYEPIMRMNPSNYIEIK